MFGQFLTKLAFSTQRSVPRPSGAVQDVGTFLGKLKRGCDTYTSKFPTWDSLFQADGRAMEKLGIPVKPRRWILLWTEKFRQGVEPQYIRGSRKDKRPKKTTRKAFKHL